MKWIDKAASGFDGAIGFLSPKAGIKRQMYRDTIKRRQQFGAYRGAEQSPFSSWFNRGGSADETIIPDLPTLRERSRALNRNDGHAAGVTSTMVTNVVGTGIRPQSRVDYRTLGITEKEASSFQKLSERAWKRWVSIADASGRMDFYEIQQLVERQILENGEAIIVPTMVKDKTRRYSLALQVIEADRLCTPPDKRGDKSIRAGIKLGENGEPVAYYIKKTHPGDYHFGDRKESHKYVEIPARNKAGRKNVIHLYYAQRGGQTRGLPFFTPVLNYFKDLSDYMDSELVAAKINSCYALIITSELSGGGEGRSKEDFNTRKDGKITEMFEPGMIKHLRPGESAESFNPQRPTATFDPFVERCLRTISTGLGLPYELVAKDFSKTNYSSARAALLEARRYFKARQEWLARKLCQPIWEMVQEEAYLRGDLSLPGEGESFFMADPESWTKASWIAPGWEWVDPFKEAKAADVSLKNGVTTYADICASKGQDWEESFEQRKREQDKMAELGLAFNQGDSSATNDDDDAEEDDDDNGDAKEGEDGDNGIIKEK